MKGTLVVMLCMLTLINATPVLNQVSQNATSNINLEHQFHLFTVTYNKVYSSVEEYSMRKLIFINNLLFILDHNLNRVARNLSYTLDINHMADIHHESTEFHNMLGLSMQNSTISEAYNEVNDSLPALVDWRTRNAVTRVKNQGACGSCWSFSSTGAIEGAWAIKKGSLISLSEQQLMDCSSAYGTHGCSGGWMISAFVYVIENGICTEDSYPYTAKDGTTCKPCRKVVRINGFVDVSSNNEAALKGAVAKQPVSVAIQADARSFQFYKSGVYNDINCGFNLNHGVLIVGYGTTSGKDYWTVKNSWGPKWGESGYIKIARNDNRTDRRGLCGIAMYPAYPTIV